MIKGLAILVVSCLTLIIGACKPSNEAPFAPQSINDTIEQVKTKHAIMRDTFGKKYLMGQFDPQRDSSFVVIPIKYADREGLLLRKEVMSAFQKMHEAALLDGITLTIRSATRNFDYQKSIWERKWNGATTLSDGTNLAKSSLSDKDKALKILLYSSMPGTSRHHWGTDIDLNSFDNSYFSKGQGLKEYQWLTMNGPSFGFVQVYTTLGEGRPSGYQEEKWHWSYQPIASQLLKEASLTLSNQDIQGFDGSHTATDIDVVSKYILGVSKDCY